MKGYNRDGENGNGNNNGSEQGYRLETNRQQEGFQSNIFFIVLLYAWFMTILFGALFMMKAPMVRGIICTLKHSRSYFKLQYDSVRRKFTTF